MGVTPQTLWKRNKEEIQEFFRTDKIQWTINEKGVNKIERTYKGDKITLTGETGKREVSVMDFKEQFAEFKQHLAWKAAREGSANLMPAAIILPTERDGRGKNLTTSLPTKKELKGKTFSEILEYLEENYPDITIIVSETKK